MRKPMYGCSPEDLDQALGEIQDLLSLQQLEKEYELLAALHEIGEILCRDRLRMRAEELDYHSGLTMADLRKLSKKIAAEEKKNSRD